MQKLILILLCIFSLNLYSINLEITVNTPGTLSQILGDDEDYLISISGLKINGIINDEDFKIIKLLSRDNYILYQVGYLDLSDCSIVGDTLKYIHLGTGTNSKLTYLNLPKTLKVIENDVFGCSDRLKTIILHENLEYIGASAFAWCRISEITFPSTLKILGDRAFSCCTIETINCYSIDPPETFKRIVNGYSIGAFGGGWDKSSVKLHCPIGNKSKYRSSELFGRFSYIIQDLNVISNTTNIQTNLYKILNKQIISDEDLIVYNINGIQMNWKNKVLNSGLYIIKHKDNIIKMKI